MSVLGVPGRTETVTTSFSSLPSVRPSEFIAAFDALRIRGVSSVQTLTAHPRDSHWPNRNALVSRPACHSAGRRARTDEDDPARRFSSREPLLALSPPEVRQRVRDDRDEREEVDVKELLDAVEGGASECRHGS